MSHLGRLGNGREERDRLYFWQKPGVQKRSVLFVLFLFMRRVEHMFATKKGRTLGNGARDRRKEGSTGSVME